jgi:predicted butyrate kinase (DUF1464 family)
MITMLNIDKLSDGELATLMREIANSRNYDGAYILAVRKEFYKRFQEGSNSPALNSLGQTITSIVYQMRKIRATVKATGEIHRYYADYRDLKERLEKLDPFHEELGIGILGGRFDSSPIE